MGKNSTGRSGSITKSSFTSTFPGQLKWHNTVAQDFNPSRSNNSNKRSSSMAFSDGIENQHTEFSVSVEEYVPHSSPVKKPKVSRTDSFLSTPIKMIKHSTFRSVELSASSGIQTPPPSSSEIGRKRAKNASTTQDDIETINTPSRSNRRNGTINNENNKTSHRQTQLETIKQSPVNNDNSAFTFESGFVPLSIPMSTSTISSEFSSNSFWDGSMSQTDVLGNLDLNINNDALNAEMSNAVASSLAAFDWSLLDTSDNIEATTHDFQKTMQTLGMQDCLSSAKAEQTQLFDHNSNLTFLEELNSAVTEGSSMVVNPNLIFANQYQQKQDFLTDMAHLLPYQQQFIQQQEQEQLANSNKGSLQRNAKDKLAVLPNSFNSKAPLKVSKKPTLRKVQSEAVLSIISPQKRTAASELTKFNVTPSKRQNRNVYGNDENITPSPPATSHRASSPARSTYTSRSRTNSRPIVNFSVSPGGRAKVQTVVLPEPQSEHEVEVEDCDSDSSTDIDELVASSFANHTSRSNHGPQFVTSTKTSFDGDRDAVLRTTPKRPQLARFNTTPISARQPKSALSRDCQPTLARPPSRSRSSPSTSIPLPMIPQPIKNLLRGQKPTSTSRRKNNSNSDQNVPPSRSLHNSRSLCSTREESDHSEAETVVDEHEARPKGDAIQALKQVIKRRRSNIQVASARALKKAQSVDQIAHSFSYTPSSHFSSSSLLSSPPYSHQYLDTSHENTEFFSNSFNISPSTASNDDFGTPSKYQDILPEILRPSKDTRCRCGVDDGDPNIIQCDTCNKWLHFRCEGIITEIYTDHYTCSLCTLKQLQDEQRTITKSMLKSSRGRRKPLLPSSPLARKVTPN